MKHPYDYILVIGQSPLELPNTSPPMLRVPSGNTFASSPFPNYPIVAVDSASQAIAQARAKHPYLVILVGDDCQVRSPQIAKQIRQSVHPEGVVIVALTESSESSWPELNEDEDAQADIDGFFVRPLSPEVLDSLNESAIAKKNCGSKS